jgi:hypothetical protein
MLDFEVEDIKELSGVGDSFVNLIYSIAVSNANGKPLSKRASNFVLSEAVYKSGLRETAGNRVTRHDLGDFAECMIFDAWLRGNISLEACVKILTSELKNSSGDPKEASVEAFTALLLEIKNYG